MSIYPSNISARERRATLKAFQDIKRSNIILKGCVYVDVSDLENWNDFEDAEFEDEQEAFFAGFEEDLRK
tara:strand:+ start:278 stop:487 length:210 start_codon:yes stop_codon:yes gene_type:complete